MKLLRWFLCSVLSLALAAPAFAVVTSRGADPQLDHKLVPPVIQLQPCSVLWFGDATLEIPRLTGLGLSITQTTNPADLSPANLVNYDVLVVAYTGPGVIGGSQAAISAFVAANKGLLIHQPNNVGAIDYAPSGFGVTITSDIWCNTATAEAATIVNGAHPITSGLVDSDLSGDFDTATNLGGAYTLLARNVVCVNNPALAAGGFGTGRVAFETGYSGSDSIDQGSDLYWARLFEWLCVGSQTPTDQATWGRVKVLYR